MEFEFPGVITNGDIQPQVQLNGDSQRIEAGAKIGDGTGNGDLELLPFPQHLSLHFLLHARGIAHKRTSASAAVSFCFCCEMMKSVSLSVWPVRTAMTLASGSMRPAAVSLRTPAR